MSIVDKLLPGTLVVKSHDATGRYGSTMVRSTFQPHNDVVLIYKALEFRDAAARDGRVFVCTLVSKRKAWLLRMLGVKL